MIWKKATFISFILIFAGFVLSGVALQAVAEDDGPSDLDTIVIHNEDYSEKRRGPVRFTHKKHALDYQISCWQCHHVYDEGKNIWAPWEETDTCSACHDAEDPEEGVMKLQTAYHINCKNCHKETAEAKKQSGPYRKCYGCHEKGGGE